MIILSELAFSFWIVCLGEARLAMRAYFLFPLLFYYRLFACTYDVKAMMIEISL